MKYNPVISAFVFSDGDWAALKRTLWSLDQQIFRFFEIIILQTSDCDSIDQIQKFASSSRREVRVMNTSDDLDSLTMLFNKALTELSTDYVFTTKAGCILKEDVLQSHFERRGRKKFLSGGYYNINRSLFNRISKDDIATQRSFDKTWLISNGLSESYKNFKLTSHYVSLRLMDALSPKSAVWHVENSSGWLADLKAVNGIDVRYYQENFDIDLGVRLTNHGIMPVQICYSALVLRPDEIDSTLSISHEMSERNRILIEELHRQGNAITPYGINL